jgi:hypothetical protein
MKPNLNINNINLLSEEKQIAEDNLSHPLLTTNKINPESEEIVEVKVATWNQTYFDLFDYENHNYDMKRFQFKTSANFDMIDDEIEKIEDSQMKGSAMLRIEKRNDGYYIKVDSGNEKNEKYFVVSTLSKENHSKGYILGIGDILKLGEVKFKISEFRNINPETAEFEIYKCEKYFSEQNHLLKDKIFDVTQQVEELEKSKEQEEEELTCRYCLVESISEDPIDNLLVHPCDCSGGSGYVHVLCLRSWIQQKIMSVNTEKVITYKWDNLKCEVCKKKWPIIIKYKETCRRLFDIEKPESAYMLFEQISLNKSMSKSANTMTMVLQNNNKVLTVGRDHKNHLRLMDPSISSSQAQIQYFENNFVIKDTDSKFGTIVKLKTDWKIGTHRIAVQVGKTVFTIRVINI